MSDFIIILFGYQAVGMDFPESKDISSSKHLVSVTESFKSDKKISIHVEHSKNIPDPLTDLPTLSTKPKQLPTTFSKPLFNLPPLNVEPQEQSSAFSKVSEIVQTHEEKINVLEPPNNYILFENSTEFPIEEQNNIEDTSISKKSALSFFKNIIKENEGEMKMTKIADSEKSTFAPQPPTFETPVENLITKPSNVFTKQICHDSSEQFESIYTTDGFLLQPEPPPKMGFISKSQIPKGKEQHMADRVKKLEESHKALSEDQIPSGAVKIFPTPTQSVVSVEICTQTNIIPPLKQTISSETISTQKSVKESFGELRTPIPLIESCTQSEKTFENLYSTGVQTESVEKPCPVFNVFKFEPAQKGYAPESYNSFEPISSKSEFFKREGFEIPKSDSLGPIVRPSADIHVRPQSPRPSAEGISMEKLWASKKHDDFVEIANDSPTLEYSTPTEGYIQHFEKSSTFKEVNTSSSPLLSAPSFHPLPEYQRPFSVNSFAERPKSPSAEGLAMDKLWGHRASTQKKTWPPDGQVEESHHKPLLTNGHSDFLPKGADSSTEVSVQKENFIKDNIKFESESVNKVEKSTFISSQVSENIFKNESAFREVTPSKPIKPYIPPPSVPPASKIIYVAETHASHSVKVPEPQPQVLRTETNIMTSTHSLECDTKILRDSTVVEERVLRPTDTIKNWPPFPKDGKVDFKPNVQKQGFHSSIQKQEIKKESSSTIPLNSAWHDIPLQPGPPPEIAFAEPPRRRQSYVETIEQDLEKNIDKVPTKHLAGAVRIIPPPLKKDNTSSSESSSQIKTITTKQLIQDKKTYVPESINKPLPKMEPFPFKPDPPRSKPTKCPPPPRPSRFVKGSFTESEYESDCDSVRIPVKWNPWQSDSEDYSYRKVRPPPPVNPVKRPHSATGQPVPPSEFEKPSQFESPSKSVVTQPSQISKSAKSKIIKTEETYTNTYSSKETKMFQSKPQAVKPASPPYSVPKHKPTSPKSKPKGVQTVPPESGYMADTDEPPQLLKLCKEETDQLASFEQARSEKKTSIISGTKTFETKVRISKLLTVCPH